MTGKIVTEWPFVRRNGSEAIAPARQRANGWRGETGGADKGSRIAMAFQEPTSRERTLQRIIISDRVGRGLSLPTQLSIRLCVGACGLYRTVYKARSSRSRCRSHLPQSTSYDFPPTTPVLDSERRQRVKAPLFILNNAMDGPHRRF
jgi:hypothetical protein